MTERYTYEFDVKFDLLTEANITAPSGVTEVEIKDFSIKINSDIKLTPAQRNAFTNKVETMYNNKMGYTSTKVELHTITGGL